MAKNKVVVVGAGPGGLTAAMLLSSKGYDVEVFEKQPYIGGRNCAIEQDGFTFDMGPTFLMMTFILEEMFELAGRSMSDYLDIRQVDPLYRLSYGDGKEFFPTHDSTSMEEQINRLFPGNLEGYRYFLNREKVKYDALIPCLQLPYNSYRDLFRPMLLRAAPVGDIHKSLFNHLGRYFDNDDMKMAFTFQSKYLGMSPWKCPGMFSIISYIEHTAGVHHPIGGLNAISHAMAKVIDEEGGKIHLNQGVKEIALKGRKAVGVELEKGEIIQADSVIINADFAYAMCNLIPEGVLKKWSPENLKKRNFSCSGYMIYLGVDKIYEDRPHHSIIFAEDYQKNITEIAETMVLSEEPSIYIQNASVTDSTLAPPGQSTVYILVPIANNRSNINWDSVKDDYREKVLDIAENRGGFTDLRQHIISEKIITPKQFEEDIFVYEGAVFNLAHSMNQMLLWRPHNKFEELDNCYLVGGGTSPGSGLPTIYESARISAGQIMKSDAWYLK